MVLRNRPTLSVGTERLACLNSPLACSPGPSPSTRQVLGSSPGPGRRAARAFFLHPPFLPSSFRRFFFRTFPTTHKSVRVNDDSLDIGIFQGSTECLPIVAGRCSSGVFPLGHLQLNFGLNCLFLNNCGVHFSVSKIIYWEGNFG